MGYLYESSGLDFHPHGKRCGTLTEYDYRARLMFWHLHTLVAAVVFRLAVTPDISASGCASLADRSFSSAIGALVSWSGVFDVVCIDLILAGSATGCLSVGILGSGWTAVFVPAVEAIISSGVTAACTSGCGVGASSAESGLWVAVATVLTDGGRMTARFSGMDGDFSGADAAVLPVVLDGGRMTIFLAGVDLAMIFGPGPVFSGRRLGPRRWLYAGFGPLVRPCCRWWWR